jgi:DNA processing protein
MDERTALLALSRVKGIGNDRKKWIVESYDKVAALFDGRARAVDPISKEAIRAFRGFKTIEAAMAGLSKAGIEIVTIKEDAYPALLRALPDPPMVLYKKGPLSLTGQCFAIVGARKATFEGMLLAERIAETLSSAGITVVSGLARGIDGAAHKGALHHTGGTVGVLGCGIDICYPVENSRLFEDMAIEGAIITEYTVGESPLRHHFPERNRIIAGLAAGVLVVEASAKSGSLITARLALDYGREVMAIPGRVYDEAYKGANNLIKQGARLVEDIGDIVTCCFPGIQFRTKSAIDINEDEDYIYTLMGIGRTHVDELIEKSGLGAKKVMAILTRLEMKDVVRPIPGGFYIRKA